MKYIFETIQFNQRTIRGLNMSFGQYKSMARSCYPRWAIIWESDRYVMLHYLENVSNIYKGLILYDK